MIRHLFLICICLVAAFIPVFGQQTEAKRARQEQVRLREENRIRQMEDQRRQESIQQQNSLENWVRESEIRARTRKTYDYKPVSKREKEKIKAARAPNPEDLVRYRDFLRQPNTGLFRLFPDFDCETKNLVRVNGDCANTVPGSWNYSFRWKDYSGSDFWDIQFKDGNLIGKSFLSQEILVSLGDVPLENVLLSGGGMKFLEDFKPDFRLEEAKKQFAQITEGIESDGYKYTNSIKADVNTTYALRVIAYRVKAATRTTPFNGREMTQNDLMKFYTPNDKRVDLTIAFRIVRRDADDSLTILWKELNRRESPKIVFGKHDKLSDIKPQS